MELILLWAPEDGHHQPWSADAYQWGDYTPFRLGEWAKWGLQASRCWVDNCLQEHFWLLKVRQNCEVLICSPCPVFRILSKLFQFEIKYHISFIFADTPISVATIAMFGGICLPQTLLWDLSMYVCPVGSVWRVGHLSRLKGVDLYRTVYNTMESDPGNCQAKYKKSILQYKLCSKYWESYFHLSIVLWSVGCFYKFLVPSLVPLAVLFLFIWKVCFQTAPFLVLGLLLLKGGFLQMLGNWFHGITWAWNMDLVLATNTLWTHSYFKLKWLMTYGKLVKNLNYWPFRNVFVILLAKEPFLVRNCICISESTLRVGQ